MFLFQVFTVACAGDGARSSASRGDPVSIAMSKGGTEDVPALPAAPGLMRASEHTVSLSYGGKSRSYILHLPGGVNPTVPAPLVLHFHGYTSSAQEELEWTGLNATADREGFVIAYPNGYGREKSWNGGDCCGVASTENLDDVGLARAIVADISRQVAIDPERVYASGYSNGGFLSHRIACEASDLFAAVAPVAGVLGIDPSRCRPARSIPVFHIHGTKDDYVPYPGGANLTIPGKDFRSVADTIATWVHRNGCTDAHPTLFLQNGTARCERYTHCTAGAVVALCTLEGEGHCWPGNPKCYGYGHATTDLNANNEIWNFFTSFRLHH